MFVQQFVLTNDKENNKALLYWPFFMGNSKDSPRKRPLMRKEFPWYDGHAEPSMEFHLCCNNIDIFVYM